MINYAIYESTGRIVQMGSCLPDHLSAQLTTFPGCYVIEIDDLDENAYISGGRMVQMPERPSKHHEFDYASGQWIGPPADAMAKFKAIAEAEGVIASSLKYLSDTDWYAVRLAEAGTPIPEEVIVARAAARVAISEARSLISNLTQEPQNG